MTKVPQCAKPPTDRDPSLHHPRGTGIVSKQAANLARRLHRRGGGAAPLRGGEAPGTH